MYTLINGSPKYGSSNSEYFLKTISKKLDSYNLFSLKKDKYETIIHSINNSDAVIFAFPLYVDSPSSITLSFLDYILDNKINLSNKLIYVIVNCGFRESTQNETAINILKNWCKKANATYMSSILIGAGEIVGNIKFKSISHNCYKKLQKFSDIIRNKQKSPDLHTTVDLLNNRLFCLVANISWNKTAKKNGLSEKDVRRKY